MKNSTIHLAAIALFAGIFFAIYAAFLIHYVVGLIACSVFSLVLCYAWGQPDRRN